MKKCLVLVPIVFLFLCSAVFAGTHTYRPEYTGGNPDSNDYDLGDLDHNTAYSWGIDLSDDIDFDTEKITGFSLFFENIKNWKIEPNVLYVNLLNGDSSSDPHVSTGVHTLNWNDGVDHANYYWNGLYGDDSNFLFQWNDMDTRERDVTISINDDTAYDDFLPDGIYDGATLKIAANSLAKINQYASSGIFGLGFDPDCHFFNDGITLTLTTASTVSGVPEPATFILFGFGLLGASALGRKKMGMENKPT